MKHAFILASILVVFTSCERSKTEICTRNGVKVSCSSKTDFPQVDPFSRAPKFVDLVVESAITVNYSTQEIQILENDADSKIFSNNDGVDTECSLELSAGSIIKFEVQGLDKLILRGRAGTYTLNKLSTLTDGINGSWLHKKTFNGSVIESNYLFVKDFKLTLTANCKNL